MPYLIIVKMNCGWLIIIKNSITERIKSSSYFDASVIHE